MIISIHFLNYVDIVIVSLDQIVAANGIMHEQKQLLSKALVWQALWWNAQKLLCSLHNREKCEGDEDWKEKRRSDWICFPSFLNHFPLYIDANNVCQLVTLTAAIISSGSPEF